MDDKNKRDAHVQHMHSKLFETVSKSTTISMTGLLLYPSTASRDRALSMDISFILSRNEHTWQASYTIIQGIYHWDHDQANGYADRPRHCVGCLRHDQA